MYAFKRNTSDKIMSEVNTGVSRLVGTLKKTTHPLISESDEFKDFTIAQNLLQLTSIGNGKNGKATQFSMGVNYWNHIHWDSDFFLCMIGVV